MLGASDTLRKFSRVMNTDVLKGATKLSGFLAGSFAGAVLSIPRFVGKALVSLTKLGIILGTSLVAAATAAGGALLYLAKRSADAIDALRVQSIKLGVSTAVLSDFGLAAEEAGVSTESVGAAIFKLSRAVGEASIKGGAARDALKELGLSAYDLIRLKPDEQFIKVAAAINQVSNQSTKARLAVALFGKGGAEVLPLFAENLQEAQKWARILNLEISDFDAAQVDAAGDSVGRLQSAFTGVGNYLATRWAPIIKSASDTILGYIEAAGGVANVAEDAFNRLESGAINVVNKIGSALGGIRAFAATIGVGVGTPGNVIRDMQHAIQDILPWLGRFKDQSTSTFAGMKSGLDEVSIAILKVLKYTLEKGGFGKNIEVRIQNYDNAIKALEESSRTAYRAMAEADERLSSDESGNYFKGISEAISKVGGSAVSLADQLSLVLAYAWKKVEVGATSMSKAAIDGLRDIQREAALTAGALEPLRTPGAMTAEEYFKTIPGGIGNGPSDKIFNITDKTVKQQETFADEMTRIWARTADSISDSLASALLNGENAFKSLANVAKSVAEQILSAFINKAFISPIIGAITGEGGGGGILSIFGRSSSGVAPSSSLSGIASSMSGASSDAPPVQIVFKGDVYGMEDFNKKVKEGVLRSRKEIEQMADSRISSNFARKPAYAVGR